MVSRKIKVLKKHIDNAVKRNSHRCMIADAIAEQIPSATHIIVDAQSIRFSNKKSKTRHIYLTPPLAQRAIINFDQGVKCHPFEFSVSAGHTRPMRKVHKVTRSKVKRTKHTLPKKRFMPTEYREFGMRQLAQ